MHHNAFLKHMVKLTEKDRPFKGNEKQEKPFQELKEMFSQDPILVHTQSQGTFVLDTEANNEGISTILSQLQDGQKKVIAFRCKISQMQSATSA